MGNNIYTPYLIHLPILSILSIHYPWQAIEFERKTPGASTTFVHLNAYKTEELGECFERNAEGMLKNMAIHELAVLATYYGQPEAQPQLQAPASQAPAPSPDRKPQPPAPSPSPSPCLLRRDRREHRERRARRRVLGDAHAQGCAVVAVVVVVVVVCSRSRVRSSSSSSSSIPLVKPTTHSPLRPLIAPLTIPSPPPSAGPSGKEFTDFAKIGFTITTKDGKSVTVRADRCGSTTGGGSEAVVTVEGVEKFKSLTPEPALQKHCDEMAKNDPDMMPYFVLQHDDYIKLKETATSHILSGASGAPPGMATIDIAVETLRVAEYLTPFLQKALAK